MTLTGNALLIANVIDRQLVSQSLDVPMLPEVASKVVTLSQDSDSDASMLSKLIQSDQSLAGHVMRVANSAAYSPNGTLVSLQQAIARLGMNLISEIALTASINTKMFNTPGYENEVKAMWRHSLATALWSKEIARTCRRNVESTFLCGLLHAIGQPVCLQMAIELATTEQLQISREEMQAVLEVKGQEITNLVLAQWDMPMIVRESAHYMNRYQQAPTAREVTAVVVAGAAFASAMLAEDQDAMLGELQNMEVMEELNLYADEITKVWDKADQIKAAMESMTP